MKRNLVIATVAAAMLIGGTYTAVAVADDGASATPVSVQDKDREDDGAADDDRDDDQTAAPAGPVTAAEAVAAALEHTPGTVDSVDLDDDEKGHWEVSVIGKNDREHELKVDTKTGAVRAAAAAEDDDDRDDDGAALRAAAVDARQAAEAALKSHPGATVTSVDFDDEGDGADHWEVELQGGKGHDETELKVDAKTGDVSSNTDASDD
ncbi:PepSY domain-containing protein [Streptomyces sp. NPDC096176]|uniref:PepSY domain-containing protein n=1 Tax=Streptomyces sp. NPDC096176 TaxID=3366079 RepID=UPI00382C0683